MGRNFNAGDNLESATTVATTVPMTFSCWFRASANATGSLVNVSNPSAVRTYFSLEVRSTGEIRSLARNGTAYNPASTTANYSTGQWHHAAVRFISDSERHVYLDGGNKGSNSVSVTPSGVDLISLGILKTSAGDFDLFSGDLAEVAIWNAALSEDEILSLSQGFSPLTLANQIGSLKVYQDLIRDTNRPGIGPAVANNGSTAANDHPPIIYPSGSVIGDWRYHPTLGPYRQQVAQTALPAAVEGQNFGFGAETGTSFVYGEVTS